MKTREEIENKWIEQSEKWNYGKGSSLCGFLAMYGNAKLRREFSTKVWNSEGFEDSNHRKPIFMSEYYYFEDFQDQIDMTYLLRALTLNILLDDNAVR